MMATTPRRYSPRRFLTLALPLVSLLLPYHSAAEELQSRPWGRLDKPVVSAPQVNNKSGYLGRYNPWTKGSEYPTDETPRYRNHDEAHSTTNSGAYRSYDNTQGASPQPYTPYGPEYSYPPDTRYPYGGGYSSPMQGLAPWGGGLNPNYGNYWNDPYDERHPDTGILWSDMWRR